MSVKHALKTALAAALTIVLVRLLGLSSDWHHWPVVVAVVVMQTNLGGSFQAAGNQLLGAALGALTGTAFCYVSTVEPVAVGGAVLTAMLICSWLRLKRIYWITATTTVAVVIARASTPAYAVGLDRFLSAGLGVAIALLVQGFLWPSRASPELRRSLARHLAMYERLYRHLALSFLGGSYGATDAQALRDEVRGALAENLQLLQELNSELRFHGRSEALLAAVVRFVEDVDECILAVDRALQDVKEGDALHHRFQAEVTALVETTCAGFLWLASALEAGPPPSRPEFNAALMALHQRLAQLREENAFLRFQVDEVLRFHSLLFNFQRVTDRLGQLTASLDGDRSREPRTGTAGEARKELLR